MRKTFADQFFGITWENGTIFYMWMDDQRFAIKGKINGNVFIGGIK